MSLRKPRGGGSPQSVSAIRFIVNSISDETRNWLKAGDTIAKKFPGYNGSQIVQLKHPSQGWLITFSFDSPGTYRRWESSPERSTWLDEAEHRQLGRGHLSVWGIDANARDQGTPRLSSPPKWKQTIVIYISFLPLSLLMNYVLASTASDLPLWAKVTISVGVLTPLMTYIFIPRVSAALSKWLTPEAD